MHLAGSACKLIRFGTTKEDFTTVFLADELLTVALVVFAFFGARSACSGLTSIVPSDCVLDSYKTSQKQNRALYKDNSCKDTILNLN